MLIVIAVLLLRMLLTGSLFLATVDDRRGMVTLQGWPMISFSTSHLIDEPGRVVVRGDIVHRTRSSERQQAARGPRPDGW